MTSLHRCLTGLATVLLLTLLPGCGEIELPTADDPQPPAGSDTENPTPPEGDDGKPSEGDDGDKPSGGDDKPTGDDSQTVVPVGNIGVSIVSKRHIVIDGLFYLSRNEAGAGYGAYADAEAYAYTLAMAENYTEEELEDWRIPTEEEARLLRFCLESENMAYGSEPLPILNQAIKPYNWEMLSNDIRYLCDDGRKSFNLHTNGKITKSGAKTVYSLRLVHDLPSTGE